MAKARLLYKKISVSLEVNKLSLPARLLFTWMISHADDDGRLRGESEYIKAVVVPLTNWKATKIFTLIIEIYSVGLIDWYRQDGYLCIQILNWNEYQKISKKNYKKSVLPRHLFHRKKKSKKLLTKSQTLNLDINVGSNNRLKNSVILQRTNSKSELESIAKTVQNILEPDKPETLHIRYLKALQDGIPVRVCYQFVNEIKQDSSVDDKGKAFDKKVEEYLRNIN